MTAFFVVGAIITAVAGISLALTASSPYPSASATTGSITGVVVGGSLVCFGFLAMLFYFVAASIEFRLTHPVEPLAPLVPAEPAKGSATASKGR
jgi:hypothetical protein